MMKLKKEIKRAIFLVIAIILIVVIIKAVQGFDSTKKDLKKKGYSKEEIVTITEKMEKDEITKILELEYQEKLTKILNEKYYIPTNLMIYLEQAKPSREIKDTISMVNVNSYKDWYKDPVKTNLDKINSMLANKYNYLEESYSPDDIVKISNMYAYDGHSIKKEVYDQYVKMWKEAKKENLTLLVNSSYRTFSQQQKEYNASNDDYAAKPGYSEHQTGLALDIVTYDTIGNNFENTDEFKWLQENAHKYGFILRYPKDKEYLTGYHYESWHYRYLGIDLAAKVKESGLTYDEYYAYYCLYKNEC